MFVYVLCVCKRKEKKKNHRNLKFEGHLGTSHEEVCAVMGIITIMTIRNSKQSVLYHNAFDYILT